MKEITGNIWDLWEQGNWIVIPTNGSVNSKGECIMGRGLALEAKTRLPKLPKMLGSWRVVHGLYVEVVTTYHIISFPVKFLWSMKAEPLLIATSCRQLSYYINVPGTLSPPIYLPRVGCGNGHLDWGDVRPILEQTLDDRFIVVSLPSVGQTNV